MTRRKTSPDNLMDGLACPNCGQSVAIDIEVQTHIRVDREDVQVLDGKYQLFDGCEAGCPDCHHIGDFEDFKVENQKGPYTAVASKDPPVPRPTVHEFAWSQRVH